jgi:hypothetical protein
MELEKFDLERALAGEPVITRLGKEVTQLVKFEADRQVYPLMGDQLTLNGGVVLNTNVPLPVANVKLFGLV